MYKMIDLDLVEKSGYRLNEVNINIGSIKRVLGVKGHKSLSAPTELASSIRCALDQYIAMTNMANSGYDSAKELADEAEKRLSSLLSR
jgi:hypothetical protein